MAAAAAIAVPASANVYVDENFEDSTPFSNLGWAIQGDTIPDTNATIAANQGINVRSANTNPDQTSPIVVMNNSGTVSGVKAFTGIQSLQLASGQSFAVNGNAAYVNAPLNWYNVVQFAVSANAATFALPASTQVGHFRMNYSNDGSTGTATIETVYQLNLVRNAGSGIDIVVQQGSTVVGTITAANPWAMVSVIVQKQATPAVNWECWDPLRAEYIGPQPTGDPFHNAGTYATVAGGISVFVNSNTAGNYLSIADIGNNFCLDGNLTFLVNWEVAAENGGTVYVDEPFWAHGLFQNDAGDDVATQAGASRMNPFTVPTVPPTAAKEWKLLQ